MVSIDQWHINSSSDHHICIHWIFPQFWKHINQNCPFNYVFWQALSCTLQLALGNARPYSSAKLFGDKTVLNRLISTNASLLLSWWYLYVRAGIRTWPYYEPMQVSPWVCRSTLTRCISEYPVLLDPASHRSYQFSVTPYFSKNQFVLYIFFFQVRKRDFQQWMLSNAEVPRYKKGFLVMFSLYLF